MAPVAVQRVQKAATAAATISFASGDGWSTPTAGNLIVVTINCDVTVSTPSGYTLGPNVVDDNAVYLFYKIAAGAESTVTVPTNGSTNIAATCCEYSGLTASPIDVSNTSANAGVDGTTTTSTSITTTAAGDLVIAVAGLADFAGARVAQTGPTRTHSFTNQLTSNAAPSTNKQINTFYAELTAGAAGAVATSCSWTGLMPARQQLIVAFKAATGGGS
ncbi:MAG: hypothetical protein JWO67_2578, partial [Streptosporangiaceae bacterium]|nr:hypothetical protein [Streptosporangiaceae bacterium]